MLFSEIEDSNLTCIQSETIYTGTPLLNEIILKNSVEEHEIHWFCYDVCSKNLRNELNIESSSINFHDCFPKNLSFEDSRINELSELLSSQKQAPPLLKKMIIVIDSFSTLLLSENQSTVNNLFRQICSLSTTISGITSIKTLLVFHPNILLNTSTILKHLKYLSKVWLKVGPKTVIMNRRKSNGKLITKAFEYKISESGKMILDKKPIEIQESKDTKVSAEESNPIVSTFKLDLTDQEKEARNAVQLPYVRTKEDEKETFGSQIHYNPDEFDDWDEEDPDNDLEFV